jgi:kynureninase
MKCKGNFFTLLRFALLLRLRAVAGHLHNPNGRNWVDFDSILLDDFKRLVGAELCDEICVNSTLTTNLHNLLIYFYRPSAERFKIITDGHSFPSDYVRVKT